MRTLTLEILGCLITVASIVDVRADGLPLSPLDPTYEDCERLGRDFGQLGREANDQVQRCLRGPAQIGAGNEVTHAGTRCGIEETVRAFPYCFPLEHAACVTWKRAAEEQEVCQKRARIRDERETTENDPRSEARRIADMAAQTFLQVDEAGTKFRLALKLMTDPDEGLREALSEYAPDVVAFLFRPEGRLREGRADDASAVLDVARGLSSRALLERRDPVIRFIQDSALASIDRVMSAAMGELETSFRSLESSQAPVVTPSAPPLPTGGNELDCSVLDDGNASRALQARDELLWLDLVTRCRR